MMKSSRVWMFMTPSSDTKVATCDLCNKSYKNPGTSTLKRHIFKNHPVEYEREYGTTSLTDGNEFPTSSSSIVEEPFIQSNPEINTPSSSQSQNLSLSDTPNNLKTDVNYVRRKKHLDDRMLQFVTQGLHALSIVEEKSFQQLVSALDYKYYILSQKQLAENIQNRYKEIKIALRHELKWCDKVTLTIDNWSSNEDESFTTISVHFLDRNWKVRNAVLLTDVVGSRPSGGNSVPDNIDKAINEFGLTGKISTFVTDDNWDVTDSVLKSKLDSTRHHVCLAHALNLAVSTAIDTVAETKSLIERIVSSVLYFCSEVDTNSDNGLNFKPHWISNYKMLEYFMSHFGEISAAVCFETNDHKSVQEIIDVLRPFCEIATELSMEENVPASKINPIVKILKKISATNMHPLSIEIYNNIVSLFSNVEEETHLIIATLLDPRFKKSGFFSSETASKAMDRLRMILRKENSMESSTSIDVKPITVHDIKSELSEPPIKVTKSNLWAEFDDEFERAQEMSGSKDQGEEERELSQYLEMPVISRKDDSLDWWYRYKFRFPCLEHTAMEFLSIPATSMPSHRIFSKGQDPRILRRALLKRSNVNMVTFLSQNQNQN